MTAREPHIPDGYTAKCRECKAKIHEIMAKKDNQLSTWELDFLGAMLLRRIYTDKMMRKIDQIYKTKM